MQHGGHRLRMRQRYLQQGLDGFAEHEVLELLLFYAIPQKNVNPLAHTLLERFGTLYNVLNASPEQLMQVDGIGEYAAALITLFSGVARRAERSHGAKREKLSSRQRAVDYCVSLLAGEKRELFYAVCMNGQMETLGAVLIAKGSLSDVPAYPRIVMDAVLTRNAHGVLLCHNHPGGTIVPSQADLEATATLSRLLGEIEVTLVDHIIVAERDAFSMVRNGLIKQQITPSGVTVHVECSDGDIQPQHNWKIDHQKLREEV